MIWLFSFSQLLRMPSYIFIQMHSNNVCFGLCFTSFPPFLFFSTSVDVDSKVAITYTNAITAFNVNENSLLYVKTNNKLILL